MSRSNATVQERLKDHFKRLSDDILASYRDALHSGTAEAVACYRETHVQEVVGRFFPRTYRVAKGAIYDSVGGRSASIDCVVCAPNHPLLMDSLGRVTTLLADGVQCAIEVKPDLRDMPRDFGESRKSPPEIIRGLGQVRTVKRLERTQRPTLTAISEEMQDYQRRIPTYILSMEPVDLVALGEYVAGYYVTRDVPVHEQVDWIAVLGVGLLYVSKAPERRFRTFDMEDPSKWMPALVTFPTDDETLEGFMVVATSDEAPEMRISPPLLERYLELMLPVSSATTFRTTR